MGRRTYDVVQAQSSRFIEPTSFDEAVERRHRLQGEVERIQEQLSDKDHTDPATGRRMEDGRYRAWRKKALAAMHAKQEELRDLKAWVGRKHSNRKSSEWSLLARAYRLFEELGLENNKQVEELLDDIEYAVPQAFLDNNAERLPRTG